VEKRDAARGCFLVGQSARARRLVADDDVDVGGGVVRRPAF
jgi:hypothetical protein